MGDGKTEEDAADIAREVTVGLATLDGVALVFTLVVRDGATAVMDGIDGRLERGTLRTTVNAAPQEPTAAALAIAAAAMRHYADAITKRLQASGHRVLKAQPVKETKEN